MNEKFSVFKNIVKDTFKEFKIGTKTMFKEFFNKDTNKKQRANMWTFIRLMIPFITLPISIWGLATSTPLLFIIAGIGSGFGAVTDYFDGKSARKYGSESKYGKLLDQVSDKIFAGMVGINLLFINFNYIFLLLGELLIATVNTGFKIKEPKLDITSTKLGKLKEWPLFISLSLGFLSIISPAWLVASNISIIITSFIQMLTSFNYIEKNNLEIRKMKRQEKIDLLEKMENEDNNKKELILSKEKEQTLLEKYKDLSNLLKQILEEKEKETSKKNNDFTKTKKL